MVLVRPDEHNIADSAEEGLSSSEARARLLRDGPNAVRSHHAQPLTVLARQLRTPLMALLAGTAIVSFFVGQRTDAVIIGVILSLSVALGFVNEYRAERAAAALHSQLRHRAVVRRDGRWTSCDVTDVVVGDAVRLDLGAVVPADVRVTVSDGLECDESVLTGESLPAEKSLSDVAAMGTVVRSGAGEGVVVATGDGTQFGRIALGLGERQEETEFQAGLRQFSGLLATVALVLSGAIFAINVILERPLIDALLFSLAIAVGITPQLLPAVVTTSLATGSRRLAAKRVLVKRLVVIEDLGDIELLLTDKTGTLTEGHITFQRALDAFGSQSDRAALLGLVCTEPATAGDGAVGADALDAALWDAAGDGPPALSVYRRIASAPFDHERRRMSVLVDGPDGRMIITKGAPEGVLALCDSVPDGSERTLATLFDAGSRVVAVATRLAPNLDILKAADEKHLALAGFLVFLDPPKASAAKALQRLDRLGITVKVVTGDNPTVAQRVWSDLGLPETETLTGTELDRLDDDELTARLPATGIFARVNPEQKSRLITAHRTGGGDVAFLGDGVNDAIALHHADVGISVESGSDVAKDAADVVLLDKDLDVLADGVVEGRRTFANTIKYVLMGTSSNFGNMFSAAAASAFLKFLPMLPSQILLNNLLYDASQMAIPTDRVDEEQLARPSHWDVSFIRRFMLFFGPISSLFDFVTFAVMLGVFHAGPALFRSGWFVESLATQTLVIFVVRTRRVPFFQSRPSRTLLAAAISVVVIGAVLPFSPFASTLGFAALPAAFFAALVLMVAGYMTLVDLAKREFYAWTPAPVALRRPRHERRVHRRAARFSHHGPVEGTT